MNETVLKLNAMLVGDTFDRAYFESLLMKLNEHYHVKLRFYDLELYTEQRMISAQQIKRDAVDSQDYELAAHHRDIERTCEACIEMKKQYNIKGSILLMDNDHLLYFYMGTSKNDKLARAGFNKTIALIGSRRNADYLPFPNT